MDNVKIVIDSDGTEYAIIENADGSFTSMTKRIMRRNRWNI
jgi:hypothetical protein